MRWYSFDPFAHVPKEQATVGALRAEAAGHDVDDPRLRQGPLRAHQQVGVDLATITRQATA